MEDKFRTRRDRVMCASFECDPDEEYISIIFHKGMNGEVYAFNCGISKSYGIPAINRFIIDIIQRIPKEFKLEIVNKFYAKIVFDEDNNLECSEYHLRGKHILDDSTLEDSYIDFMKKFLDSQYFRDIFKFNNLDTFAKVSELNNNDLEFKSLGDKDDDYLIMLSIKRNSGNYSNDTDIKIFKYNVEFTDDLNVTYTNSNVTKIINITGI